MRDFIRTAVAYFVCLALILLCFKLYKWHNRVVIKSNDTSMKPEYPPGNHALDISATEVKDLDVGRAVAFRVPTLPDATRVGWVLAREGQMIEIKDRIVLVDGVPAPKQPAAIRMTIQRMVVPKGCVFVMAHEGGEDSSHYGPLPMRSILGVLEAVDN